MNMKNIVYFAVIASLLTIVSCSRYTCEEIVNFYDTQDRGKQILGSPGFANLDIGIHVDNRLTIYKEAIKDCFDDYDVQSSKSTKKSDVAICEKLLKINTIEDVEKRKFALDVMEKRLAEKYKHKLISGTSIIKVNGCEGIASEVEGLFVLKGQSAAAYKQYKVINNVYQKCLKLKLK